MKKQLEPTVIYRKVNDIIHVLNYTTGKIMSFECGEEDIKELINSKCDNIEVPNEVKRLILKKKKNPNTRLCRFNLVDLGMEFSFPTTVNIELNQRCNLRCIHCYIESNNVQTKQFSLFDDMLIEQIESLLDSLKLMGVFLIVLTGGEPFLNKNIERIVLMASEKGFVIEILSNLQFVPDWILNLGPNTLKIGRIQTSVYSADSAIHDRVTAVKGSFDNTIENLCILKCKGYYLEVATPLMNVNFETRNETVEYFKKLDIHQSFAWPIINEYKNSTHSKELLNISLEQVKQFANEQPGFFIQQRVKNLNESICAAGRALLSISHNGDVWPCSQYPLVIGNIQQENILKIFSLPAMCEIGKRKKSMFIGEKVINFCMGINYSETGNPFLQPDFLKRIIDDFEKKGGEKS